jgi:hypothetical protein
MPRPALLLTCLLALATALALLGVAATRPPPRAVPGAARAGPAARAAVRGFYDAVNAAIATGETAPLAAVLAPDYAERAADGAAVPGRAALERAVRALHAVSPGLRLEPEVVAAEGDRAAARVRVAGGGATAFLGLALAGWIPWGPVDLFRLAGGRVAERASAGGPPGLLEPLVAAPVELGPPADRAVSVARVTLAPGGWRCAPGVDGLHLLVVEAGEVAVAVDAAPGATLGADPPVLDSGDWRFLPERGAYEVRNLGSGPAVLLEVLATATTATQVGACAVAEGATTRVLAGGQAVAVAGGPVAVAAGRVVLPPGGRLAWAGPAGAVLLAVEAGTLGLAAAGAPWVRRGAGGAEAAGGAATLAAGDGALLDEGAGAELRNAGDGPLRLLVVTLLGGPDARPRVG